MKNNLGKKLVKHWIKTLEGYDVDSIIKIYSKEAILLGTLAPEPLVGRSQIKTYFDDFVKLHPEGKITWWYNQRLSFNNVVVG
jgi:hypothetical protein